MHHYRMLNMCLSNRDDVIFISVLSVLISIATVKLAFFVEKYGVYNYKI